jgi:CheY-like chemotaxis protein
MTVADTGSGIAPEHLPQIFDPFFTTKEVGKGTGLGLATVYGIVKQHQGWIEVSSKLGVGSQFRIFLPALECAAAIAKERAPETGKPLQGTETVLVVEDEKGVRTITRLLLEHFGYRVLEAGSGPEALKVWQTAAAEVDLLLTDMIMPQEMNGRKLAEKLRGQKSSLKVIFQSGYGGEVMGDDRDLRRESNGYFLQKPCSPQELLSAVRRCLDGEPAGGEHFSLGDSPSQFDPVRNLSQNGTVSPRKQDRAD